MVNVLQTAQAATFVDVVLDVPTKNLDKPFTYAAGAVVPAVGCKVKVPFGDRTVLGWVVAVHREPDEGRTVKPIGEIAEEAPLPAEAVELARWMQRRYASTLREALHAVASRTPRGAERFCFVRSPEPENEHMAALQARFGAKLFSVLTADRALRAAKLALPLGALRARIAALARDGILERQTAPRPRTRRSKRAPSIAVLDDPSKARGPASRRLVRVLSEHGGRLEVGEVRARAKASAATVRGARAAGVLHLEDAQRSFSGAGAPVQTALVPNAEQRHAIERIDAATRAGPVTVLLEGITGSGKTFVYSRLIDRVRTRGGKAVVLVPEIALTPQTAARFAAVFGSSVGVLHSGLSEAERAQVWRDASAGTLDVVVGARSAVFAPLPQLALIVVDEEHEASYKQDVAPRYHAAGVAMERMRRTGGAVVLGSATPSLESYRAALEGEFLHVHLSVRATAAPLPPVQIVDMTGQPQRTRRRAIGATLAAHLETALASGGKALLFLNRRGYAGVLLCRACGFAPRCRRCAVSLVVHAADRAMRCHVCGDAFALPRTCPKCKSDELLPYGFGTQRLEEEVKELFPDARVVRMDSDSTSAHGAHERLLTRFATEADVLIGTQMIAKGLDYPAVTLVGVVAADQDLNRPDFRAAERTFALLTQVAGRAGRASAGSRVLIQTYSADHYAVEYAARHDYRAFAAKELPIRRELRYPPFGSLAYLIVSGFEERAVAQEAAKLGDHLRSSTSEVEVLGPAPDVLPKARGEFRMRIALKANSDATLLPACALARERKPARGTRLTTIVDPR